MSSQQNPPDDAPDAASEPEVATVQTEAHTAAGPAARADVPTEAPPGLEEALAGLGSALSGLTAAVQREHERAGHREAVIDRLHEDNQVLRRGELQVLFEPVRAALYRLHDQVRRESARWAGDAPPGPEHAAPLLAAIADEIAEALGRTGAERFEVAVGERFDSARHRPAGTDPVADPALDGTVTAVLADGFEGADGTVVRRAQVRVGKPSPAGGGADNGSAPATGGRAGRV